MMFHAEKLRISWQNKNVIDAFLIQNLTPLFLDTTWYTHDRYSNTPNEMSII